MKKILCLAMCAVFAAALPARAQSDEYRDAVAEMMELTGALRNADVVVTQMIGYLKTSAPAVSEAVWEKIISKFNEKMRARMVDIYVPIYSKYLTLADLRELNALYAKPVMRKAVGATPAIMQEGMSAGAALGQEIMTELPAGTAGRRIRIAAVRHVEKGLPATCRAASFYSHSFRACSRICDSRRVKDLAGILSFVWRRRADDWRERAALSAGRGGRPRRKFTAAAKRRA